jgi:outer membrane receptor protein involved in Fe transport
MRAAGWGFLLYCAVTPALAQVETVVVTARPPDPVGNDAFSVVRLGTADVRALDQLDRSLEQVPGLSTFRRDSCLSANPTTQGVSLRAIAPSGAGRALVTLDGVPQNDPFGGWVLWCSPPPEDIESAEVVRGAGAGPYGAGALTGVVALSEAQGQGVTAADASIGSMSDGGLGYKRAAAAGGVYAGPVQFFASAADENSAGWIPVSPEQRGAADVPVTLDAKNASLRIAGSPQDGTNVAARVGIYDERRDSGLKGAASDASGTTASLTVVHPDIGGELGWRLQGWLRNSDFANSSVSIAAHRASTTPTNDEFSTPARGWGVNGAVRGSWSSLSWEAGLDARATSGETRELFSFSSGNFTMKRTAGGQTFVGGVYVETASRVPGWLFTLGLRADEWASTGGHLSQSQISTGTTTLSQHFMSRSGIVPTARAGLRHDFEGLYFRTAAYAGFRAPTLNELYRPFRLGNNFTEANAALVPEKLYGAEIGAGGTGDVLDWDATVFWNRLHGAITNVTLDHGPRTFPPPVGFIPAGGLLIQRQNVGDIDAYGLEAELTYRLSEHVSLKTALDLIDARVFGGTQAPQLTGKRPAQAPSATVTASVTAHPLDRLSVYANLRFESARFADDQNTLRLPAAATLDAKISWAFAPTFSVYLAADNLLNTPVATTESADPVPVVSESFPRIVKLGIAFSQ